ncbi:LysR substrate-binding domain-containing protein [Opitutus sp. ER46]|uniref:LysR substrate-binding domain-containing protein n=1 Tax=Opitutus sp. ER46 TaxID=2161864 RepID=UPI000D31F7EE|nr:LysR substrate-binding domain-containing protein [Opitutus sp. ER46]PTX96603.1 LysR family transcriptional regulator [Opitutus sp. ER46]
MDYNLRELECFTAAAEELSFTRAAAKLHLAQPPLSRHIRALEEKVGAELFQRGKRGVALTPAGALFYEETRMVLPQLVRAGEAVRRSASGETSRLRLGFVSAVLGPELVHVFRAFREQHPNVQLMVQDSPPAEQLAAMAQGTLDGGFVGLHPAGATPGVQFVPWQEEPLLCFVPAGHPLAHRRQIELRQLAGEPMIAVSSESAPAFAEYIRELCRQAKFRPRIVLEAPRAQAVGVMVAAGCGVALLPASLGRVVGKAAPGLPLAEHPRIVHVFARRSGILSGVMKDFVSCFAR